jgi:hypothetical protein
VEGISRLDVEAIASFLLSRALSINSKHPTVPMYSELCALVDKA